ncbi:MAG: hypothetical protein ACE5G2_09180, partial [Candidatus Krumholzibacteriia bacterium]
MLLGVLGLAATALVLASPPAPALVWTEPAPVMDLSGQGDVLAAATQGGVVLWNISAGTARVVTTAQGLPTNVTLAASIAPELSELRVATTNGLARGWFEGPWTSLDARQDEKGNPYYTCMPRPGGGWIAGGDRGRLVAWQVDRIDSLQIPTPRGRIVGLAHLPDWTERRRAPHELRLQVTPAFPVGLIAALDNDGVWILRSFGSWTRWLKIGEIDGLPSERTLDVVTDVQGDAWVATTRGIARIGPGITVQAWPGGSLLAQRSSVLL